MCEQGSVKEATNQQAGQEEEEQKGRDVNDQFGATSKPTDGVEISRVVCLPSVDVSEWQQVASLVKQEGVCALRNVWTPDEIADLLQEFQTLKPTQTVKRRAGRWDAVYDPKDPFFAKLLHKKPIVEKIMKSLLGSKFILEKCGSIDSHPGSVVQRWHMDNGHLFSCSLHLPAHSINSFIVPTDLVAGTDNSNGPTEFQLGTHMKKNLAEKKRHAFAAVPQGSIVVYDTRIMHRGGANRSDQVRSLLYLTFSRPWYRDTVNP